MSSINQKPQLRKHLDVTDVYQNKAVEQELDKQLDNLAQPTYQNTGAISQNKTSSSTKGCRLQMIKNNQEQEQEYRISINSNQVEEKHQSAFFQQFGFINANDISTTVQRSVMISQLSEDVSVRNHITKKIIANVYQKQKILIYLQMQ